MLARAAPSPSLQAAWATPGRLASVACFSFCGAVLLGPSASACRALEPSNKPVDACVQACSARASRQCSEAECGRGCEFVLDRLVENEMDVVVGCVARSNRRCADMVWAECASHVGAHADGGPPLLPPPLEDE